MTYRTYQAILAAAAIGAIVAFYWILKFLAVS